MECRNGSLYIYVLSQNDTMESAHEVIEWCLEVGTVYLLFYISHVHSWANGGLVPLDELPEDVR